MRVYPVIAIAGASKKLRRLPHVFSKMIELPFGADADVYIKEEPDMFRFSAATDGVNGGFRAHAVVVHPGVMKVVVLNGRGDCERGFRENELDMDRWRFRLPPSTLPMLATAEYADGELIVTVPKGDVPEEREEAFEERKGGARGSAAGQLVVVITVRTIHSPWYYALLQLSLEDEEAPDSCPHQRQRRRSRISPLPRTKTSHEIFTH